MKKFLLLLPLFFLTTLNGVEQTAPLFKAKNYSSLIGMEGFSDAALHLHLKLYEGYVKNTNQLTSLLTQYATEGKDRSPEYAEIKRRLMWEYDGMRLHEYYFDALGGKGSVRDPSSALSQKIDEDFGSFEKWKADFVATGSMRGIGWAILYYDPVAKRLVNAWVNEHNVGHLAGGEPLLCMDVFEHAYMIDYGMDRAKYIDAFFANTKWPLVESRYNKEVEKAAVKMEKNAS